MTQTVTLARRATSAVLLAAALAMIAACKADSLLKTDNPDVIDPGALNTAQGATALYNGAIGDFAVAADGSGTDGPGLIEAGAWFTDEARFGGTPPEVKQMDLRAVREEAAAWQQMYLDLHHAREGAEKAAKALASFNTAGGKDSRVGEMYALSALVYILFGEHYCSGVPFSTTEPSITYGQPLSTTQIFSAAIAKLDLAKQNDGGDPTVMSLEAVLRGRALLNLAKTPGDYAAAAAAVASVPTDFVYQFYHGSSTARQNNYMYTDIFNGDRLSTSDTEGANGLNFGSANDPRVPVQASGLSRFDNVTPMVRFLTYNSLSSPVVHASGIEARMIEAEAALAGGDVTTWLAKLNGARSTVVGLAPLADPGTPNARVDLMFRERAFWMYMTGHRLGDLRRMIRQYGRGSETVFPTGAYHKDNLVRGTDVNIVIPISERNNPNFHGCLDRNA
jgi:hypothetical protein